MPWMIFYFFYFFHPMPQPVFNKGVLPPPPAIVQPAPVQNFNCRVIKYPNKSDPTMITLCP
jgi:hypothetical protein